MWFKILIIVLLIAILISLSSGMVFLIKDKGKTKRTVNALTIRVALSVALFILLFVGYLTGQITPQGVYPG